MIFDGLCNICDFSNNSILGYRFMCNEMNDKGIISKKKL